ncbi:hypothetical protein EOL96_04740 [Candidatus Saccharibacteria bacterium]|nr:hypothetical protein [Candidatus Saccharibacteria bacterium]
MPTENPGQTLGIIGIVCNVVGISIGGIILGVMSRNKSKQYGMSTTLGTVSLVWGIVSTVLVTLWILLVFGLSFMGAVSSSTSEIDTTFNDSSSFDYEN